MSQISDFVDTLIKAKNAIGGDINNVASSAYNNTVGATGSFVNDTLNNYSKQAGLANDAIPGIAGTVNNAVSAVTGGKVSPETAGKYGSLAASFVPMLMAGTELFPEAEGDLTSEQAAMRAQTTAEKAATTETPPEVAPVENPVTTEATTPQTGDTLIRDMRTTKNPNFKVSPETQTEDQALGFHGTTNPATDFSGENTLPGGQVPTEPTLPTGGKLPPTQENPNPIEPPLPGAKTIPGEVPGGLTPAQQERMTADPQGNPTGSADLVGVKVTLPQYSDNVNVRDWEAKSQNAVDRLVPGTSAPEIEDNIKPTITKISGQISSIMENNPKSTNVNDLITDFKQQLQDDGIYRQFGPGKRPIIDQDAANYIKELQNSSGMTGDNISDQELMNFKKSISQDMGVVSDKKAAGIPLDVHDRVVQTAYDAVDQRLAGPNGLHPGIKELTTDQSSLYKAQDSAYKSAESQTAEITTAPNAPNALQRWNNYVKQNPAVGVPLELAGLGTLGTGGFFGAKAVLPAIGGAIAYGAEAIKNKLGEGKTPQTTSFTPSIQPDSTTGISYDSKKDIYSAPSPQSQGLVPGVIAQTSKINALNQKAADEALTQPLQAKTDYQEASNLQTTLTNTSPLGGAYSDLLKTITLVNEVRPLLKQVPPNILNQNQTYDQFKKGLNGKYGALTGLLDVISQNTNFPISGVLSGQALEDYLVGALDSAGTNYLKVYQQQTGSNNVTGTASGGNNLPPTLDNSQPSNLPDVANFSIPGGGPGAGLPQLK
jgi:hypothetical protein